MPVHFRVAVGLTAVLVVVLVATRAADGEEPDVVNAGSAAVIAEASPLWEFSPVVIDLVGRHPDRLGLAEPIVNAAEEFGVDPARFGALVWVESSWRTNAVSEIGAIGPAQLRPTTAAEVAARLGEPDLDVSDPEDNLRLGAAYLATLIDRFDGDRLLALAAYHAGPSTITASGAGPQGLAYALKVEALVPADPGA